MKTNTEKTVDKVLPGKIFMLIGFSVKAITQVNPQHTWVNFNTFPSCFLVNCVIQVNLNIDAVRKESFYVNHPNLSSIAEKSCNQRNAAILRGINLGERRA